MAGFEVVVRPVVLPNIRPAPAQTLPPADDPEKGFCTIRGNPAKEVNLTSSSSSSMSRSHQVETQRRVDVGRVYQENDDGSVNRENFVDVEVANKIKMRSGKMPVLNATQEAETKRGAEEQRKYDDWFFKRLEAAKNIEIKKKDEVRKNQEAKEGE